MALFGVGSGLTSKILNLHCSLSLRRESALKPIRATAETLGICPSNFVISPENLEMQARVRSHHATVNSRFKNLLSSPSNIAIISLNMMMFFVQLQ
ncbi:LOW QUALITY PROTEIN: hypothetical protein ACHAXS_005786 [Conticribra weissflogii]